MIFRSEHTDNYTVIPNQILNHPTLSWLSIGVLLFLISKPRDFEPNILLLKKHFDSTGRKVGRERLQGVFRELIDAGYIIRKQIKSRGRNCGVSYWVFDVPQTAEMMASDSVSRETASEFPLLINKENKKIKKPTNNPNPESSMQDSSNQKTTQGLVGYFSNRAAGREIEAEIERAKALDAGIELNNKSATALLKPMPLAEAATQGVIQGESNVHHLMRSHNHIEQSIGKVLTADQTREAHGMVGHLLEIGIKVSNPELLIEEVIFALLDKNAFSGTGQVFSRKLGAIRSVILSGNWTKPMAMRIKQQRVAAQARTAGHDATQKLKDEIRALRLDIHGCEQALLGPIAKGDPQFASKIQDGIANKRLKLNPLLDQLAALSNQATLTKHQVAA